MDRADGLRVVHVIYGLDLGGLEHVVLDLCARGRPRGVDGAVVSFGPDGPLRGLLREHGVPLHWLGDVPGLAPRTLAAIAGVVDEVDADVLHGHDAGPWLNAAAVRAARPNVAVVATFHQQRAPSGARRVAAYAGAAVSSALVACGEEVRRSVASWAPRSTRLEVIANGVAFVQPQGAEVRLALRRELGIPEGALVIGSLGRLSAEKGPDLLLEAFDRAFARRGDVHLLVVGGGPMEEELRRRASPRVRFTGATPNGRRLLAAMDVYAQPSRTEGRSLAMLEAMSAGLPTVAFALPPILELHGHEESALLAPPADAVALATLLARAADDTALRQRLGEEGRRRAAPHSADATADAYVALWRDVAARRGLRRRPAARSG